MEARRPVLTFCALTLAAAACETTGEPDPGGLIEATSEGALSDATDTKLKLAAGDAKASVNFKKMSGPPETKVKARLVSGVEKMGAKPAGNRVVQVLPKSLVLTIPAELVMLLDPPAPGKMYRAVSASEDEASWAPGEVAENVPLTELEIGGGDKLAYRIHVAGPRLWGIVEWDPGVGGDGGVSDGGGDGGGDGPSVGNPVVRTIAFHEITTAASMPNGLTGSPIISGNGNKIAFAYAPGTGDPKDPQRIYTINPDGTGFIEVDSYTSRWYSGAMVEISGDGATVLSSTNYEMRVVGSDGTKKATVDFDSYEIAHIALTADGKTAFMTQRRDNSRMGVSYQRGVYSMDTTSGAITKVVDATGFAAVVGAMPADVFPFDTCGRSLAVSGDGKRIVFSASVGGMGPVIATVGPTGGAKVLLGPIAGGGYAGVQSINISADGSRVLYDISDKDGLRELGTIGFDGSGRTALVAPAWVPDGCGLRQVSADGSQILTDKNLVYPSAGGDPFYMQAVVGGDGDAIGAPCCDSWPAVTMSGSGKRFSFTRLDDKGKRQLGFAEIDPVSLGTVPSVTEVSVMPSTYVKGGAGLLVTAKISGTGITHAGTAWYAKGLDDYGQVALRDDGMKPDVAAGDGVWSGTIYGNSDSVVGARIVRVKAEAVTAGRRQATAVDVGGVDVKAP